MMMPSMPQMFPSSSVAWYVLMCVMTVLSSKAATSDSRRYYVELETTLSDEMLLMAPPPRHTARLLHIIERSA